MEMMLFSPLIISAIIFIACLASASSRQNGLRFVGYSVLVFLLMCVGAYAFVLTNPELITMSPLFGQFFGGPFGLLVFIFFFAQCLPGIASLIAITLVTISGGAVPAKANPYGQ